MKKNPFLFGFLVGFILTFIYIFIDANGEIDDLFEFAIAAFPCSFIGLIVGGITKLIADNQKDREQ